MDIVVSQEKDISIFALGGRLDAVTASQLEERLGQWFAGPGTKLVFNMAALDYISSAGLRVFLTTAKKMKARSGKLCVAGLQENIKQVFEISGFNALIPACGTLPAALDALG